MARKKTEKKPTAEYLALATSHFGEMDTPEINYWLPTGCLRVDLAIGQGLPGGTLTEMFGDTMAGKTTFAMSCCRQAQLLGGNAFWFDLEGRFSPSLAVKYNNLDLTHGWYYYKTDKDGRPLLMEYILDFLMELGAEACDKPYPTVIVVDSVAALRSKDQDPEASAKRQMGKVANVFSGWFTYGFNTLISGSNVHLIFLNQTRDNLDFWAKGPQKSTTPAGKAVKFYASTRLEFKSKSLTKSHDPNSDKSKDKIGRWVTVFVEKNTHGPPFRSASFPFYFYDQLLDWETEDQRVVGMDDSLSQLDYLISRDALAPGLTKDGKVHRGYYEIGGVKNNKMGWRERMRLEPETRKYVRDLVHKTYKEEYG